MHFSDYNQSLIIVIDQMSRVVVIHQHHIMCIDAMALCFVMFVIQEEDSKLQKTTDFIESKSIKSLKKVSNRQKRDSKLFSNIDFDI